MKKIIAYIILVIIIFFAIPIIFTIRFDNVVNDIKKEKNVMSTSSDKTYDYGEYNIIKLYHKSTKKVEKVKIDTYVSNVVAAEIPVDYDIQALKAQAIVARTYTVYKMKNGSKHKKDGADICDDSSCCQAWISKEERYKAWKTNRISKWRKIEKAVNDTRGLIITYNNKPINAFFHSNSGGFTDSPKYVWGGEGYPYLKSVETSGEDGYEQYSSSLKISKKNFIKKLKEKHKNFKIDFKNKDCINIQSYTSGKRVNKIKIGNTSFTGVEIRQIFSLKSARFKIKVDKENVYFEVIGYGHGVGLSQTGSDSLAKQGKSYEEIIKHFYTGVKISKVNY